MAKEHFKFDPETLSIRKVTRFSKIMSTLLPHLMSIVVISIVSFYAFTIFFDKPSEKNLKYQNKILKEQQQKLIRLYSQNEKSLRLLEQYNQDLYKLILGTSYIPPEYEKNITTYENIANTKARKINKNDRKRIVNLLATEKISFNETKKFVSEIKPKMGLKIDYIPSILPITKSSYLLFYGFGFRLDPYLKIIVQHNGIDLLPPKKSSVFATATGVVEKIGTDNKKGKYIVINHRNKYTTYYYNIDSIFVRENQTVRKGQKIATTPIAGNSNNAHLHYEIHYDGKPIDPVYFFFGSFNVVEFFEVYNKSKFPGICLE